MINYADIKEIPQLAREEWEPLVQFGFAPGSYFFRCKDCELSWNGVDKRASRCYDCAKIAKANYTEQIVNFDFFAEVENACKYINNGRGDQVNILSSLTEEVGELATEIRIGAGLKDKPVGKDGVVGEAIDVILCALDIIHSELGSLDQQEIARRAMPKLTKWMLKYKKGQ